jgi:hypothetical protein
MHIGEMRQGKHSMFSFGKKFQDQIIDLALQIAQQRRGEDYLQDIATLHSKFNAEWCELQESDYKPEEITDVLYYAICLAARDDHSELDWLSVRLPMYGYSQEQIEAATLAKYQLRASGKDSKDKDAEYKAISNAMQESL